MDKKCLELRLDLINKNIEVYKRNAMKELEKEEMIPLTSNILMIRDLKEQQGLIEQLLESEE